jgi:hypothetical protein
MAEPAIKKAMINGAKLEGKLETAKNMYEDGMSVEKIKKLLNNKEP